MGANCASLKEVIMHTADSYVVMKQIILVVD